MLNVESSHTSKAMDFTGLLPREVSQLVFKQYTLPRDWQNIAKVSHRWHSLIPDAYVQFSLALGTAKRLVIKMPKARYFQIQDKLFKQKTMRHIAKIEAPWNIAEANSTASQMPDLFFQVPNIYKGDALVEIVRVESKQNLSGAKFRALHIEGGDGYYRDKALLNIVAAEVHADLNAAKATAERIERSKIEAYLKIAEFDPSYISKAKAIAKGVRVLEIIRVEAGINLNAAKETAKQIKERQVQIKALIEIAKMDPHPDLDRLKGIILDSGHISLEFKIKALIEVSKMAIFDDLADAKQLAGQIINETARALSWIDIVNQDLQHDFSQVKIAARQISDEFYRDWILRQIAMEEAKYDFFKALETIEMVQSQDQREYAFSKLAELKAQTHLSEAKAIAAKIDDDKKRAETFIEIGKIDSQDSLVEAKALIAQIACPEIKSALILQLAEAYALRTEKHT